jgi:D-arginine dehydrogenase
MLQRGEGCWGMDTKAFDVVVIGAGMAGATAAAALSPDLKVALIEAEEAAGYHSTGRSAAIWILNYGPADVRVLTGQSRSFFEKPPPGFSEVPLIRHRPVVFVANSEQLAEMEALLAGGAELHPAEIDTVYEMVPALRPGYLAAAAIEPDAFDLDVAAILQGFLRQLRANGGVLTLRSRAGRIERVGGEWQVETSSGTVFTAPIVVNASGAWGDEVGQAAGAAKLGLTPCRRTAAIIDPSPFNAENWPMIIDAGHQWYVRPEARTRLLVSPEDQTPSYPHDIQPDELDIAIAIDRMQQALDIEVNRVEHSWAGLRTFTPDGSLAFGWDSQAEGFFWAVGQGGYGIQTSPAAGLLVADMITGRDPGEAGSILAAIDPKRFGAAAQAR